MEMSREQLIFNVMANYPPMELEVMRLLQPGFSNALEPLIISQLSFDSFSSETISAIMQVWFNPELAHHVRSFEVCWCYTEEEDQEVEGFDKEGVLKFVDYALDTIFEPKEAKSRAKWKEHLLMPNEEAWFGLLLVRLHHLETLEFGYDNTYGLVIDILRKAARRQRPFHEDPPFPCLKKIIMNPQWGGTWTDSNFIDPFFFFPAVETIECCAIGESDSSENTPVVTTRSARPVRNITVKEAYWTHGLFDWLDACTQLEHLSIKLALQRDDEPSEEYRFRAPQFRRHLLRSRSTLKTLQLGATQTLIGLAGDLIDEDGPLGSLQEFTYLQDLDVRHAHLLPLASRVRTVRRHTRLLRILPASIQRLKIRHVVDEDFDSLQSELLNVVQRRDLFPRLEELILKVEDVENKPLDSLRQACTTAGITFTAQLQKVWFRFRRN
ncbi:hypothetical protein AtubIFM56815_009342 [Aspergillus tubingensis]|uniref:Leucine-rich repeat domain-containing protein n=2 Tax=Aspergillus subgen. Circumdati TaxID=2720871 RepID=A0A8H3SMS2_ASPTU|nr:similar to An02g02860 [Aspergillus tubingensis]GAQ44855.1 similar to An02g02860 [Aspergillus niger]GFN11800.1 similar to An02g02860 [Aspergillus tubingensis]GLA66651.1 hypothetical protein AtubIFM54640_009234 [Aspergillus tubingensis]GLA85115.1 hypothetical protein AtubIFM56815_009342 [Aspergillus tubingensis]